MIFYLLIPPQGPGGGSAVACPIHASNIHTKFGLEDCILDRQTKGIEFSTLSTPKTHATEWKPHSICFMSFICENIDKVWYKHLWDWLCNWLCEWNWMIFDLLTPLQGPKGKKQKVLLHVQFIWVTHTPKIICKNGSFRNRENLQYKKTANSGVLRLFMRTIGKCNNSHAPSTGLRGILLSLRT